MTCIVGVEYNNKVYMGSDSCGSNDFAKISIDAPKIFLSGDVLIGYAGSFRIHDILQYVKLPKRPKNMDAKEYLVTFVIKKIRKVFQENGFEAQNDGDMCLIGCQGKLYYISADFSLVRNPAKYASIGSGSSVAMGSLYTTGYLPATKVEERITIALRAASEHARGVAAPYHILNV
jgi:20S proteasome alpha/beta subunit